MRFNPVHWEAPPAAGLFADPPPRGFWLPDFHVELDALVMAVLLLAVYAVTIVAARRRGITYPVGAGRLTAYLAGVLTLFIGSSWPIHDLSEGYLFSMHMVQHMLFIFLAAPLILWGTPGWMLELVLTPRWLRATAVFCTRPIAAFLIFNLAQGLLHVPEVTDVIIRNHWLHFLVHLYVVASSFILWAPVLSPTPLLPRLSYPIQIVYLMLQSAIPTVVYAPLTFAEEVVYAFYGTAPRIWGLSAIHDQQTAGLLMKVLGGFIMWGWIFVAFFKWANRSEAGLLPNDFQPVDELTPSSAIRAAEQALRAPKP